MQTTISQPVHFWTRAENHPPVAPGVPMAAVVTGISGTDGVANLFIMPDGNGPFGAQGVKYVENYAAFLKTDLAMAWSGISFLIFEEVDGSQTTPPAAPASADTASALSAALNAPQAIAETRTEPPAGTPLTPEELAANGVAETPPTPPEPEAASVEAAPE